MKSPRHTVERGKKILGVSVTPQIVKRVDELIADGLFVSRSEFARSAVVDKLRAYQGGAA